SMGGDARDIKERLEPVLELAHCKSRFTGGPLDEVVRRLPRGPRHGDPSACIAGVREPPATWDAHVRERVVGCETAAHFFPSLAILLRRHLSPSSSSASSRITSMNLSLFLVTGGCPFAIAWRS